MIWCRACKAKDGEIAFLRSLLGSARYITRDPAPSTEKAIPRNKALPASVAVHQVLEPFGRFTEEEYREPTPMPEGQDMFRTEE